MRIVFNDLYKDYGGKVIFENLSGSIEEGNVIGLIGINGVGKTTLLKILAGLESKESGMIKASPERLKIGYLDQHYKFNSQVTVYDEIYNFIVKGGGESYEVQVEKVLMKVGLGKKFWSVEAHSLSGGEKTKLLLCKLLLENYDVLLLDEPTNHLDELSMKWLEGFIKDENKTMVIISHDRYFLDKVTNIIWEMTSSEIKAYSGNYSDYKCQKEVELKNTLKEYDKQQREIRQLKVIINERKQWFDKAHKAAGVNDFLRAKAKKHVSIMRAKEKALERLESNKIEAPKSQTIAGFDLINKEAGINKLPQYLIEVNGISKSYGEKKILENASFTIRRDEKIALVGNNGTGKSTLIKMILGLEKIDRGEIYVSPSLKIGYFSQELEDLYEDNSIIEEVLIGGRTKDEARLLLACLLFKGEEVFKKIKYLSMGEKCRVAFAKLILSGANLLILDEPTNYLDVFSREKIEEVLQSYKGSVLVVSHDRYLLNNLANKVLAIEGKNIVEYLGGYDYFLQKREENKKKTKTSVDYKKIKDEIAVLECKLAYISGKLGEEKVEVSLKEQLNLEFIEVAKRINLNKQLLK